MPTKLGFAHSLTLIVCSSVVDSVPFGGILKTKLMLFKYSYISFQKVFESS